MRVSVSPWTFGAQHSSARSPNCFYPSLKFCLAETLRAVQTLCGGPYETLQELSMKQQLPEQDQHRVTAPGILSHML